MDRYKEEIGRLLEPLVGMDAKTIVDLLEVPPDPDMGDIAFPCYIPASKKKQPPPEIAGRLAGDLSGRQGFFWEKAVARGPYLNFYLNPLNFGREVLGQITAAGLQYGHNGEGTGRTIVVDYSSPNIAKRFGIGHIRSTVIGHALCLLYEALGYRVIGVNHLGDWGTQFGKLIVAYRRWGDQTQMKKDPINYLHRLYVQYHDAAAEESELEEKARRWFKKLEDGDPEAIEHWSAFRRLSLENYQEIYDLLGIRFDHYHGESHYNKMLDGVIRLARDKKIAVDSEGALIVDLEKYGLPPVMLRKKDGATLYITRDLAAAIYRYKTFNFSRALYVVGAEQKLHFEQLTRVLELLGFNWAKNCIHVPFGLIRFKGGRMSTRDGNVVFLEEVLRRAIELALEIIEEKNPDLPNKDGAARMVGLGAVRFGDLSNDRVKDIEFDWDKVLDFAGETAAYIQYSHARICSILRKAEELPDWDDELAACLACEEEKSLVKVLAALPEKIKISAEGYRPSVLARYMVDVAREFNRFYHHCPVLASEPRLQKARLILVNATRQVLANGLGLLGIDVPEEM